MRTDLRFLLRLVVIILACGIAGGLSDMFVTWALTDNLGTVPTFVISSLASAMVALVVGIYVAVQILQVRAED